MTLREIQRVESASQEHLSDFSKANLKDYIASPVEISFRDERGEMRTVTSLDAVAFPRSSSLDNKNPSPIEGMKALLFVKVRKDRIMYYRSLPSSRESPLIRGRQ